MLVTKITNRALVLCGLMLLTTSAATLAQDHFLVVDTVAGELLRVDAATGQPSVITTSAACAALVPGTLGVVDVTEVDGRVFLMTMSKMVVEVLPGGACLDIVRIDFTIPGIPGEILPYPDGGLAVLVDLPMPDGTAIGHVDVDTGVVTQILEIPTIIEPSGFAIHNGPPGPYGHAFAVTDCGIESDETVDGHLYDVRPTSGGVSVIDVLGFINPESVGVTPDGLVVVLDDHRLWPSEKEVRSFNPATLYEEVSAIDVSALSTDMALMADGSVVTSVTTEFGQPCVGTLDGTAVLYDVTSATCLFIGALGHRFDPLAFVAEGPPGTLVSPWFEFPVGSGTGDGVTASLLGAHAPDVATDLLGTPTIVWTEGDDDNPAKAVRLRRYDETSDAWLEIGGSATGSGVSDAGGADAVAVTFRPDAAVPAGTPVVAWSQETGAGAGGSIVREVHVKHFDGNAWSALGPGSATGGGVSSTGGPSRDPALAVDGQGRVVVAWNEDGAVDEIYVRRFDGFAWSEIGRDSASGDGVSESPGTAAEVALVIDPTGEPVVAWADDRSGSYAILLSRWNAGSWGDVTPGSSIDDGVTGALQALGLLAPAGPYRSPSLLYDAAGDLFVAFEAQAMGQVHVARWDGVSWQALNDSLAAYGVSGTPGASLVPDLALDTGGNLLVSWIDETIATDQMLVRWWNGDAWGEIGTFSDVGYGVSATTGHARAGQVFFDGDGRPVAVFEHERDDGTDQVYARRYFALTGVGQPPTAASNPLPTHMAYDVDPVGFVLSWNGNFPAPPGDTGYFHIHLSEPNSVQPVPRASFLQAESWTPGALVQSGAYYTWRVDAVSLLGDVVTTGPTWAFFTLPASAPVDCNSNGIDDDEEIIDQLAPDCNGNLVPDACDIADLTSQDCNGNGVPDECDVDCNGNDIPDDCDITSGASDDCNTNGIPDECEAFPCPAQIASVTFEDPLTGGSLPITELTTDPTQGGMVQAPLIRVDGTSLVGTALTLGSKEYSVSASPLTEAVDGSFAVFELPAFPPGATTAPAFEVDLTISTSAGETAVASAFSYYVFEVKVPPGSGALVQATLNAALPGTRVRLEPGNYSQSELVIDGTGGASRMLTLMGDPANFTNATLFGFAPLSAAPVLTLDGVDDTVVIIDLQVREGAPGILMTNGATARLSHLKLDGNNHSAGGGLRIEALADAHVSDCFISTNAGDHGGGIAVDGASAVITGGCTLYANQATNDGGGVFIANTPPGRRVFVQDSLIAMNTAEGAAGGGVFVGPDAAVSLFDNTIEDNAATTTGSGISAGGEGSSATLLEVARNDIRRNDDFAVRGGGMFVRADGVIRVVDNIFRENVAPRGAALYVDEVSDILIARNLMACNQAGVSGPAILVHGDAIGDSSQPDILNNVLAQNRFVGPPEHPAACRGIGIHADLLTEGQPQIVNNVVVQDPAFACVGDPTVEAGWGVRIEQNLFGDIRYNFIYDAMPGYLLEDLAQPVCEDLVGACSSPIACTSIFGIVDGNVYDPDPLVSSTNTVEVQALSPAHHGGLAQAPRLPAQLYRADLPVSQGWIPRDGVLPNPGLLPSPPNSVREVGSGALLHDASGVIVQSVEVVIDVDLAADAAFATSGVQVTAVTSFTLVDAFDVEVALDGKSAGVRVGLPIRGWLQPGRDIVLHAYDDVLGEFVSTGLVDVGIDAADRVVLFDGVTDLSGALVGVVVCGNGAWFDLGQGLLGDGGEPFLLGHGEPSASSDVTLVLTDALAHAQSVLVIGLSALNAPFAGGVLVPSPDVLVRGLPVDAEGVHTTTFAWPRVLPPGTQVIFQHWIRDQSGPAGFTASNAIRAKSI